MAGELKYAIFKTNWGYFGILAGEKGLLKTCLPHEKHAFVEKYLLKGLDSARQDKNLLKDLQQKITAYFEGSYVDFSDEKNIDLSGFSEFGRKVLTACRKIRFGETISYTQLAEKTGNRSAGRAVGNILGKNRLALVIPCHRVVRKDGRIGGFSAAGGEKMKMRLLRHERKML